MVNLPLSLIVVVVEVVVSRSCTSTAAIVVGFGGIIPLFWALPSIMPLCSIGITGDARTVYCFLGPVVVGTAVLLRSWCWNCWSGCHRPLGFISGPVVMNLY